jgi:GNAT superfamily N-acetyltransferase
VDDALAASTVAAAGQEAPKPLAVFARSDDTVVAGIHGWTWGGCCELVSLWVNEPIRGRGLGRALLTAAEDRPRARGCHQVVLSQATDLYTRSGHDIVGEVEDDPAGSAAYWFRKRLDAQPGEKVRRIAEATVWVGIAVLVVADAVAGIRTVRRRAAHRLADGWARIERREQREARRVDKESHRYSQAGCLFVAEFVRLVRVPSGGSDLGEDLLGGHGPRTALRGELL